MSAKCNYSIKFAPLLISLKNSLSDADFKKQCIELFKNGESVYQKISTAAFMGSDAYLTEIRDAREDSLSHIVESGTGYNSIKSLYIGDDVSFNRLKSVFKKGVVARSLYDSEYYDPDAIQYWHGGKWIDPNEEYKGSGINYMNYKLFEWKVELANDLIRALGGEVIQIDPMADDANDKLSKLIQAAITLYANSETNGRPISKQTKDKYVILARFNQLLSELTPFIKIKPEYRYSTRHAVNMYTYDGPNVKLRMSWSNNDNPIDAATQYSDLAAIILDILPELNTANETIEGTSVGVPGFMSAMTALKTAITYGEHHLLKEAADMDPQKDMYQIIGKYLAYLDSNSSGYDESTITFLTSKLRSIQQLIYGRSMGNTDETQLIQNMFTNMFLNTEVLSYRTYGSYNGQYGGTDLKQRFQQDEEYDLQDRIRGRVLIATREPHLLDQVKEKYKIRHNGHRWTMEIAGAEFSFDVNSNFSVSIIGENRKPPLINLDKFTELIYDLFDYVIPSNYEEVGAQIFGYSTAESQKHDDKRARFNLLNDWMPLISIVLESAEGGYTRVNIKDNVFDFYGSKAFKHVKNPARVLSVIHGAETRHTVKDVNGNNLPLFGQTSLAFNFRGLLEQYRKTEDCIFDDTFLGEKETIARIGDDYDGKESGNSRQFDRSIVGAPVVREGIKLKDNAKKSASLQFNELTEASIVFDYMDGILGDRGRILMQNTTNADKSRQFLVQYDLDKRISIPSYNGGEYVNLRDILTDITKQDRNEGAAKQMEDIILKHRGTRYARLAQKVLNDYEQVLGIKFETLEQLDEHLLSHPISVSDLNDLFEDAGVKFINETHATVLNGIARVNETFKNYVRIFNDPKTLKARMERCKRRMAYDLLDSGFSLNRYVSEGGRKMYNYCLSNAKDWIDDKTGDVIIAKIKKSGKYEPVGILDLDIMMNPDSDVIVNPLLESYFYADSFLSTEYNELVLGFVWAHPYKERDLKNVSRDWNGYDMTIYDEAAEAARLIVQNKRSVTPGASIHRFTPNVITRQVHTINGTVSKQVNTGVANRIKVAAMGDITTSFDFINGSSDHKFKSMDGSGLSSPIMAIMENNSLHDAATGYDKKTILQSNDGEYGTPTLLKWAVYAITNSRRRLGRKSSVSAEDLFRKMHSIAFEEDPHINLATYANQVFPDGFYIKNPETGITSKVKIHEMRLSDGNVYYVRQFSDLDQSENLGDGYYVDKYGKRITGQLDPNSFSINTIYDIDQFFGGAYMQEMVDGRLQYTDKGLYLTTDIVINHELQDYMIAYVVNESAMKVGIANSNKVDPKFKEDAWHHPDIGIQYFTISTENGGLQMNAEHELDDAEVTEMTQMISALIENGYSSDIVNMIYEDIGRVIVDSLKKYNSAIKLPSDSKIYQLVGQALIDAYKTGSKDTLGLAQVFFARAEANIREIDPEFKIPFSAETIYPTFVSTVSSALNKKGIRRKYDGIAAVLTPAHDIIQVYDFKEVVKTPEGDKVEHHTLTYDEFAKKIISWKSDPQNIAYSNWTIDDFLTKPYKEIQGINGTVNQYNPFYERLTVENIDDLEFDTTIYLEKGITDEETGRVIHEIVVEDYARRKMIKNIVENNLDVAYISPKGRNLRGGNTKMSGVVDGVEVKFSAYDLTSVGAAMALKNDKDTAKKDVFYALNNSYARQFIIPRNKNYKEEDIIKALDSKDFRTLNSYIDVDASIKNLIQHQLKSAKAGSLTDYSLFDTDADGNIIAEHTASITHVDVTPAECVMGRMHAKKFGIRLDDNLSDILKGKSNWFYERLSSEYKEDVNVRSEDASLYDSVVYTKSGNAILVKFMDFGDTRELTSKQYVTKSKNVDTIDDIIYYNGEPIVEAGQAEFYTYTNGDSEYELMCIDSPETLRKILDLDSLGFYTFNSESKSVDKVISVFAEINQEVYTVFDDPNIEQTTALENPNIKPIFVGTISDLNDLNIDSAQKARILAAIEHQDFDWRLKKLADDRWQSFNLSLNLIGTRIPTQAMQSFMPMRVVAFSDSEVNEIYVSRTMPILQGSDYDIDKAYMLSYQIDDNGILPTLSSLSSILYIKQVLDLPAPDGKNYDIVTEDNPDVFKITASELAAVTKFTTVTQRLRQNLQYSEDSYEARMALNVLKKILKSGKSNIMIINDIGMDKQSIDMRAKQLKRLLNRHSHSDNALIAEKALKNQVVHGIWNTCTDPENQLIASTPIDMDEARDAASNSVAGEAARHASMDIPTTKFLMQVQNLVGKQCIGIVAVSVKQFFANSAYETRKIDRLSQLADNLSDPKNREEFLSVLKTMEKTNPINGGTTMLANINLEPLIDKLKQNGIFTISDPKRRFAMRHYSGTSDFKILDYLNEKLELTRKIDAALNSSGLLSAATDNAKELILAKLNATPKLIDVYTYLTTIGVPFGEIADIMTSPIMNEVAKLLNANIFNSALSYVDAEKIMRFYLDGSIFGTSESVLNYVIKSNGLSIQDWSKSVDNRKDVKDVLDAAYKTRARLGNRGGDIEDYDFDFEASSESISENQIIPQDITRCITYLKACMDRLDIKSKYQAKYNENSRQSVWDSGMDILQMMVDKVIPGTKEQQMLGRMLGINQGMATSPYDQYKLFRDIENFVNEKIKDKSNTKFNIIQFLNDEKLPDGSSYRQYMINLYEGVKVNTNILGVISDVPHFSSMFKVLSLNDSILTRLSSKYEAVQALARTIETRRPIKEKEFKQVEYYVGERIIVDWIRSQGLEFTIPEGFMYYDENKKRNSRASNYMKIGLEDLNSIAIFKVWFEDFVMPQLKDRYPTSRFISQFSRAARFDGRKVVEYYKLPIDMRSIDDSVRTRALYDEMLKDFDENLASQSFYGWRLADLFFMYNLIVNKDGFGKNSLTRFFENLVGSPNSSKLIDSYYKYISLLDSDKETRDTFIASVTNKSAQEDIKFRISKKVRGTYIKPSKDIVDDTDGNYTFLMPSLMVHWHTKMELDTKKIPHQVIERRISRHDVLREMASVVNGHINPTANFKDSGKVILCSQEKINDLFKDDEKARNNPSFIHMGTVYVNTDIAKLSDLTHEFAHMVLADLRWNPDQSVREKYYKLVSSVRSNPNYAMLAKNYSYRIGVDVDEEVLATIIGNWFGNKIRSEWGGNDDIEALAPDITESVKRMFGIDSLKGMTIQDIAEYDIDTICKYFGSHIFNSDWTTTYNPSALVKTQMIAGMKKTLEGLDKLKLVC